MDKLALPEDNELIQLFQGDCSTRIRSIPTLVTIFYLTCFLFFFTQIRSIPALVTILPIFPSCVKIGVWHWPSIPNDRSQFFSSQTFSLIFFVLIFDVFHSFEYVEHVHIASADVPWKAKDAKSNK